MADSGSAADLLADPWVAAQIDAALEPYVGRIRPAQLAWMREQLAEKLANDRYASTVLRRAHPRAGDRSGEGPTPLTEEATDQGRRAKGQ